MTTATTCTETRRQIPESQRRWHSEVLQRSIRLGELRYMKREDRVLLRAELEDVLASLELQIERARAGDGGRPGWLYSCRRKHSIAQVFARALASIEWHANRDIQKEASRRRVFNRLLGERYGWDVIERLRQQAAAIADAEEEG